MIERRIYTWSWRVQDFRTLMYLYRITPVEIAKSESELDSNNGREDLEPIQAQQATCCNDGVSSDKCPRLI